MSEWVSTQKNHSHIWWYLIIFLSPFLLEKFRVPNFCKYVSISAPNSWRKRQENPCLLWFFSSFSQRTIKGILLQSSLFYCCWWFGRLVQPFCFHWFNTLKLDFYKLMGTLTIFCWSFSFSKKLLYTVKGLFVVHFFAVILQKNKVSLFFCFSFSFLFIWLNVLSLFPIFFPKLHWK